MPTYEVLARFVRDYRSLTPEQRAQFRKALDKFIADLRAGAFRPGLRVKRIQAAEGIFEMTWAKDGRATFRFGDSIRPGQPHVVWRRIGTHTILREP